MTVTGPPASAGPALATESVTAPDVPGVIVGDDAVIDRSACGVPTVMLVELTPLSAGNGS